jgi:hypothetical protein
MRRLLRRHAITLLPGVIFFAFILLVNWRLFVTPMAEYGDIAVNALQVQNAKHFRELLGNYSRWQFHHPGPFFFYLFAAGEALFYNLLHLVPAPFNAERLAETAFSTVCLFLTIHIFYVNVRKSLFPVLAVLFSILFSYALDSAIPGSMFLDLWPPYIAMFCFLLFSASCASVAAGNWKHLPLMALSGMIMLHAHVAQALFVPVLALVALCSASISESKHGRLVQVLRVHKRQLAASVGIVLLFLLPVVIDWAIHHPNNIHQIRVYLRQHRGEHNSVAVTALYVLSFFTYAVNPEVALARPKPVLADVLNSDHFVQVYWSIYLFTALFCGISYIGRRWRLSRFLKFVVAETVLIILLFAYWSWRITGPMYTFNGYFFFSVQLLLLLAFGAMLSQNALRSLKRAHSVPVACACTAFLLLVPYLKGLPGDPEVPAIMSSIAQRHVTKVALSIPMMPSMLIPGAGVASYLQRSGIYFCLGPEWGYVFGPEHVCRNTDGYYHLSFNENPLPCPPPCSVIYSRPKLYVLGAPIPHS